MLTIEQISRTTGFEIDKLIESVAEYWNIPAENRDAITRSTKLSPIEAVYLAGHFRPEKFKRNSYDYAFIYNYMQRKKRIYKTDLMEYVAKHMYFSVRSAERMINRAVADNSKMQRVKVSERCKTTNKIKILFVWDESDGQ